VRESGVDRPPLALSLYTYSGDMFKSVIIFPDWFSHGQEHFFQIGFLLASAIFADNYAKEISSHFPFIVFVISFESQLELP
jgi:hypothetical protein